MLAKRKSFVWFVVLFISQIYAQEKSAWNEYLNEIVITDTGFKIKREHSGKVVEVIDSLQLKRFRAASVAQVLDQIAGVEINGAHSQAGVNLNYYIRGGRNRQVLILIDGIPVNDGSQIASDFDLRLLNASFVKRIEIIKGASSSLYGSGAATAVISIETKKESKVPFHLETSSIIGSNQNQKEKNYKAAQFKNTALIQGQLKRFNYSVGFGHHFTDGLSAISNGEESDRYNSYNLNTKLGWSYQDKFQLSAGFDVDQFETEFDDSFRYVDANNLLQSNQHRAYVNAQFNHKKGDVQLLLGWLNNERETTSSFPTLFGANKYNGKLISRYNISSNFKFLLGLEYNKNSMESFNLVDKNWEANISDNKAEFEIIDPYMNLLFTTDIGLNINVGTRLNIHSEYGLHAVYGINPTYNFKINELHNIKFFGSFSTAFITPSLFQLYEPNFGNTALKPEKNKTQELGIGYSNNQFVINAVYFRRIENNFIGFVDTGNFVFQYQNIAEEFTTSGLEFSLQWSKDRITANTNITYTNLDDEINLRIPQWSTSTVLNYDFNKHTSITLNHQYKDQRADQYFDSKTFENVEAILKAYHLVGLSLNHQINNNIGAFVSVKNILNSSYEEVFGFSTLGRNVQLGIQIKL